MPNTDQINPKVLRNVRKQNGMTQQQLAELIGCTKDTVSRWERGDSKSVRSHLREPLCKALKTNWEKLTDLDDQPESSANDLNKTKIAIRKNVRVALDIVALRYDLPSEYVLNLAPLLFVIVAEQSLLWRKRRLDEMDSLMNEAKKKLLNHPGHLGRLIAARHAPIKDEDDAFLDEERQCIDKRDVFGQPEYRGEFSDWVDEVWAEYNEYESPFLHYIRELVKDIPAGAVSFIVSIGGNMITDYEIAVDTLEQKMKFSGDKKHARRIMNHVRIGSIDLKECLRFKRDNSESDYQQWLMGKLEQAEKEVSEMWNETDPDMLEELLELTSSFIGFYKNSSRPASDGRKVRKDIYS